MSQDKRFRPSSRKSNANATNMPVILATFCCMLASAAVLAGQIPDLKPMIETILACICIAPVTIGFSLSLFLAIRSLESTGLDTWVYQFFSIENTFAFIFGAVFSTLFGTIVYIASMI